MGEVPSVTVALLGHDGLAAFWAEAGAIEAARHVGGGDQIIVSVQRERHQ